MNLTKTSKLLSLVLRHDPGKIGITLDSQGWVDCAELLAAFEKSGTVISYETLAEVVSTSDKQRFALNEDGTRIRANQGHSVEVDLGLHPSPPPYELFHGTIAENLESIRKSGLLKGKRHDVHLSPDIQTATRVGARRGTPVILKVRAAEMALKDYDFFRSDNGVWLTDHVPPEFIEFNVKCTTLYRPVGPKELKLIEDTDWTAFPKRLPDQPIFYPVTNEAYAIQIARDWNVKASGSGFVTRFKVDSGYLRKFPIQTVGGRLHSELWVPAEELTEFNSHIIGKIEVTQQF